MLHSAPSRVFAPAPPPVADDATRPLARPEFLLPLHTRSAILLHLLLEDNAIDLELASCVVALDPGLAFAVLQAANPADSGASIWQLASALVAAGRESLQDLLECAPRLELHPSPDERNSLLALASDAVMRAGMAQLLARELGKCHPKKCYLAGLLLEIPAMVAVTAGSHDGYQGRLLSVMCNSLPVGLVKAAMSDLEGASAAHEPLIAIVLLAEALLREKEAAALWNGWPELDREQRSSLVGGCCELREWMRKNLFCMDPWEFMSRLERRHPKE